MGPPSDALTGDGRLPHAQWSSDSGMSCYLPTSSDLFWIFPKNLIFGSCC